MIACDNPQCKYEWFHFDRVNLTIAPSNALDVRPDLISFL